MTSAFTYFRLPYTVPGLVLTKALSKAGNLFKSSETKNKRIAHQTTNQTPAPRFQTRLTPFLFCRLLFWLLPCPTAVLLPDFRNSARVYSTAMGHGPWMHLMVDPTKVNKHHGNDFLSLPRDLPRLDFSLASQIILENRESTAIVTTI